MHSHITKRFAHPGWIEIDLDQFTANIKALKAYVPKQKICLTVKANSYGHGLVPISQIAVKHGIDYLAVAHLQEGAILRESGIKAPILVLGAIHEEQLPDLLHYNLEFTLSSHYKADLVAKLCKASGQTARVHVEVETGMQRTGMRPETAQSLIKKLSEYGCFELKGVYSHLANGDVPNDSFSYMQIASFRAFVNEIRKDFPKVIVHFANSGGILYYPEAHFDMVRVGILLFGYTCPPQHPLAQQIRPFFSVKAKISFFKAVTGKQGVGYGHTYKTGDFTRIVTVPVGYGDGLRRDLSNKGSVLIRGQRYPIAGNICMDQFMVDIGMNETYVGDEVTLIGRQKNSEILLEEMAELANTIPNEILCGFNDRMPRIYKYEGEYF